MPAGSDAQVQVSNPCFGGREMKVFILGGTGFIGYHTTLALLRQGHTVQTLALPPLPEEGLFPEGVSIHLGDFNQMSDQMLLDLMRGCGAVVFAAGADDRVTPKKPAYPFFYQANVLSAKRFFNLAKTAGVSRGVLLNSYFAYFDRVWPELKLSEHHPYIRSRREQEEVVLALAGQDFRTVILELPYIFGGMPGRTPLWQPLVKYLHWPLPWVFYPRGGSAMVSVANVARVITGALEKDVQTGCYQIGDENLTWAAFLERLAGAAGLEKKVVTLPDWVLRVGLWGLKTWHVIQSCESGLDPIELVHLQTRETFFDPKPAQEQLGFSGGDLDEAFRETVLASGFGLKSN